jgi:hypothetical protein
VLLKAIWQDWNTLNIKDMDKVKDKKDFNTFYLICTKGERRRLLIKREINIAYKWRARYDFKACW